MEDTNNQNIKESEDNSNNLIETTEEQTGANKAMDEIRQLLFNQKKNKKGEQIKEEYKFWDTQPVPKINSEDNDLIGPINTENDIDKEKKEPYNLPTGFSWWDVDINKDSDITKVNKLEINIHFYLAI